MKGKTVNLAGMYAKAQELSESESEIQKLQAEVERLRAQASPELETQLEQLRSILADTNSVREFSLNAIRPNPEQPRKTFTPSSIRSMAATLAKDGLLTPVILMIRSDAPDEFDLFDGERRWRAARELGWESITGFVMPRPKDLHRKALLTTLAREDLNPLDKAEALLREIATESHMNESEVVKILSAVVKRLSRHQKAEKLGDLTVLSPEEIRQELALFEVSPEEHKILSVILGLGLNPNSVLKNDFRVLSLFPNLKEAIRSSNLKSAHAFVLQRLSAANLQKNDASSTKIRKQATAEVLKNNLSVRETRSLVASLIEKYATIPTEDRSASRNRTRTIVKGLKKLEVSKIEANELRVFRTELMTKLAEIDGILGE